MKKIILPFLIFAGSVLAQNLPPHVPVEVGDKFVYQYVTMKGTTKELIYLVEKVEPKEISGTAAIDGNQIEFNSPAWGYQKQDFSLSAQMQVIFDPPIRLFEENLKIGQKWTNVYSVEGAVFNAQINGQYLVEKFEKIKLKIGEFDSFLITHNDNVKLTVDKVFTGKQSEKIWVGVANNKLLILKREFLGFTKQNFTIELSELPSKK